MRRKLSFVGGGALRVNRMFNNGQYISIMGRRMGASDPGSCTYAMSGALLIIMHLYSDGN